MNFKELQDKGVTLFAKIDNSPAKPILSPNGNLRGFEHCELFDAILETKKNPHFLKLAPNIGLFLDRFQVLDVDSKHIENQESFNESVITYLIELDLLNKVSVFKTKSNGLHILYNRKTVVGEKLVKKLSKIGEHVIFEALNFQSTLYYDSHVIGLTLEQLFNEDRDVTETDIHKLSMIAFSMAEKIEPIKKKVTTHKTSLSPLERLNVQVSIEDIINDIGGKISKSGVVHIEGDRKGMISKETNKFYRFSQNKLQSVYDLLKEFKGLSYWKDAVEYCETYHNYYKGY